MKTVSIKKGIRMHFIPDDKFKTFRAGVLIHRPLKRAEATLNSLTAALLKRGGEKFPTSRAVSVREEELYGASLSAYVRKKGEDQIICLGVDALADAVLPEGESVCEGALELLFDLLKSGGGQSGFDAAAVAQEKTNLKDKIEAEKNNKVRYSVVRLQEEMCRGEAYGVSELGYAEDLPRITPDGLSEHYRRVLATSPIDIIFSGNFDGEKVRAFTAAQLDGLPAREGDYPPTEQKYGVGEIKRVTDEMDVTQGKLCIGFRTGVDAVSPDYPALAVYNAVFGGGPSSKLFNNVREKLSLCYYASSACDRAKGIMTVRSGIEFENFDKAYQEIMAQHESICRGEITDDEMDAAKKAIVNALRSYNDSLGALEEFFIGRIILKTNDSIDSLSEGIKRVSREEIVRAARRIRQDTVYFLKNKEAAK